MPTVITVECPSCVSTFPVDPVKIPEGGARTQCTVCETFFVVDRPSEELPLLEVGEPLYTDEMGTGEDEVVAEFEVEGDWDALATSGLGESEVEAAADTEVELDDLDLTVLDEESGDGEAEGPEVEAGDPPEAMEPLEAMEAGEPENDESVAEPESAQGFRMGRRDPHEKAQRLARVLISDMITYNPERHARGLEAGTLAEEFQEEIDKSWAEYVEQVGNEIAESTPYWTDALNEILARGEPLF
jgi:hypothetical protein